MLHHQETKITKKTKQSMAEPKIPAVIPHSPFRIPHGWKTGIRIGSTTEDRVTAFIPPHETDRGPHGAAGEGLAVDPEGNVYAAEGPGSRPIAGGGLTKYVKR